MVVNTKSVFATNKNGNKLHIPVPKSHRKDLTAETKHRPIATVFNAISGKSRAYIADRGQDPSSHSVCVLPEPRNSRMGAYKHAEITAIEEEKKIKSQQLKRESKLKQFQEEVKLRVKQMEHQKRIRQLEKSYKAVEIERHVISQSSFVESTTSKRDTCIIRDNSNLAMKSGVDQFQDKPKEIVREPLTLSSGNTALLKHSEKVSQQSCAARQSLLSRKISSQIQSLPGGRWKDTPTQDYPNTSNMESEKENVTNDDYGAEVISFKAKPKVHFADQISNVTDSNSGEDDKNIELSAADSDTVEDQLGIHEPHDKADNTHPIQKKQLLSKSRSHNKSVVNEGQDDVKRQIRNQYTMYRRLFMDIEREQVRENIKLKQHRQKVAKIKQRNESLRRTEESKIREALEPKNPITGESPSKAKKRQKAEEEEVLRQLELRKQKLQRNKEMERYINALRESIKERFQASNTELPQLCNCTANLWETNPDTCANNCIFYKNPKAYTRALSSLLLSCG
ncbi:Coiled-coil domain-containing protein 15 [Trichoplax sp. H2]|nr:Coiled-coil domain-containing protein 15 [Trichoplax sp. H2]|eukprot:RDD47661.1 Coiled-coil domain-containing protein 15 [Trichoplax sp. H2]